MLDSPEDQARLVAYTEAEEARIRGGFAGLGFALGPDGSGGYWQGIDLDDIPANGLADLAKALPGYVEKSPSGNGAHAIGYGQAFDALTVEQVVQRLEEAQIANAAVNDMHDVWKHPQLQARQRWTEVATPAGPIPALLPPGRTDAYAPRMGGVPGLGQHTQAILQELGLSAETVEALRRDGAV